MKIETLIKTIQTDKTNGKGTIPEDVFEAITGLVRRLEGMLPNVETARDVAGRLNVAWNSDTQSPMLAWAWTVWPLYHAGRIGELLPVVTPLLPKGQPFGESEIDTAYGAALVASVENRPADYDAATASLGRMVAHNAAGNRQ